MKISQNLLYFNLKFLMYSEHIKIPANLISKATKKIVNIKKFCTIFTETPEQKS